MTFATIVGNLLTIVNSTIIPLLYVLAFIYFFYGIVRYLFLESGSEQGAEKARKFILYGIIGLVVIFAFWGIVNLLVNTLVSGEGISPT